MHGHLSRLTGFVLATSTCLVIALAAQDRQGGPPPTGTGLLAGRVVDARDQSPIAYATVTRGVAQALTDSEGRFVFSDVPAGSFTVYADKPGWIHQGIGSKRPGASSTLVTLADGERRTDLVLGLFRYAVISGHVVDEVGEPLVNVDVRAFLERYVAGHRRLIFTQRVHGDDRGIYKFWNLVPGEYLIAVPTTVMSQPASFTQASMFESAYLQSMSPLGTAQMGLDVGTLPAGRGSVVGSPFSLPGAPSGDGSWQTYPTTFAPSARTITTAALVHAVSGEDRSALDITMHLVTTYQISGTLTGPEGPLTSCAVHLLPADAAEAPIIDAAVAVTDADGAFTFFGVAPGQYVARVVRVPALTGRGERYAVVGGTDAIHSVMAITGPPTPEGPPLPTDPLLFVDRSVTVGNQSVVGFDLVARPGPRLKGRAVFDGTSAHPTAADLRSSLIQLERADGQTDNAAMIRGQFMSETDFATTSIWPGRYFIRVSAPPKGWTFKGATADGQDIADTVLDVKGDLSDVVLTFTDHPTTVQGSVTAEDPKRGPFAVIIFPPDPASWIDFGSTSRRVRLTNASETGTFTLPAPPAGEYCLVAIPDDEAGDWQNPAVLARLLPLADRIDVKDGQPVTHALRVRTLQ